MRRLTRLFVSWTEIGLRRSPFLLLWAAYLLPVILLNWAARHQPYYWDAMGYVLPTARTILTNGFDPILRTWDVGHPTAYYWLLAVFYKAGGISPLTGHVFTWFLTALGLAGTHRLAARLHLPPAVRVGAALCVLVFPLVFAASRQVVHDLGLAVFVWLALEAWARRRPGWYVVWGALAALTKLYGILLVPALWLALLMGADGPPNRRFLQDNWRQLLWTAGPLPIQGLFLGIRYLVRGPGLTVNWTPHSSLQPVWNWPAFSANWPEAKLNLWQVSGLGSWALVAVGALALALVLTRRRPMAPEARRTLAALVAFSLVLAVSLVQVSSTMGRYVLPLVTPTFLVLLWGVWRLAGTRWLMLPVLALLMGLFVLQWHPRQTRWLPPAVAVRIAPPPAKTGHHMETDLRYQDVVDLMVWSAEQARLTGAPRVLTHWPLTSAFSDPDLGYVTRPLSVAELGAWTEVPDQGACLVVVLDRISGVSTSPPSELTGFIFVAARLRGEVTAWLWFRPAGAQSSL